MAGTVLLIAVICGFIAGYVASGKGHSYGGYFVVGFLLGPIGVVIAIIVQPPAGSAGLQRGSFSAPGPRPGLFHRSYYDGQAWTDRPSR